MAYQDIPLPTDKKNQSQSDIRDNFSTIDTAFSQDHNDFNDANAGKHKQVLFTQQASATSTAADEMALYVKDNGGSSNLYLREESDGTEFNLTPQNSGHAAIGTETLPSGLIMKWGIINLSAAASSVAVAFGTAFPAAIYNAIITPSADHSAGVARYVLTVDNVTVNGFTIRRNPADTGTGYNVYWYSIGK